MAWLKADGTVWMWGDNISGQCGDNTTADKSSPVSVVGEHTFVACNNLAGLKSNGEIWMWGYNPTGNVGDGTTINRSSPVVVAGNHSFIAVASGGSYTIALKEDGSAWGWGHNGTGFLGVGDTANRSSPTLVIGNHSFVAITSDEIGGGLKADGTAWMWGKNTEGGIGDNSKTNRSSPVSVVGDHSFIMISSGGKHSLGLKEDGSCWAWGYNGHGEIGTEEPTNVGKSSPVSVLGAHSFISIHASGDHSHAIKANGEMWAWGDNILNQLGNGFDGYSGERSSPVIIYGGHIFDEVWGEWDTVYGIDTDGAAWSWGYNDTDGDYGNNFVGNQYSPTLVVGGHVFTTMLGDAPSEDILTYNMGDDYNRIEIV